MDQIVAWLDDVLEYKHTVGWLLTPAYPEGLDRLGEKTSDEMYYEISGCTQRVMAETSVDIMLPAGTGIQNARTTSLDTLGLYGHLSTDGIHLSDGIPRLIENYIVTQTLLNLLGLNNSIDDDFMSIDYFWRRSMNIVEAYSIPVGMNEYNRALAKKCVHAALLHPYVVTRIDEDEDG